MNKNSKNEKDLVFVVELLELMAARDQLMKVEKDEKNHYKLLDAQCIIKHRILSKELDYKTKVIKK
jgi:hypothetical protein